MAAHELNGQEGQADGGRHPGQIHEERLQGGAVGGSQRAHRPVRHAGQGEPGERAQEDQELHGGEPQLEAGVPLALLLQVRRGHGSFASPEGASRCPSHRRVSQT